MESIATLVQRLRGVAGLSQRALARRAGTSQPAIARYERGVATPSLATLERLAAACGQRLTVTADVVPEPHDVELAAVLLDLTPEQRLQALGRYARLHWLVRQQA